MASLKNQLVSYIYKQNIWIPKGVILDRKWYHDNKNARYMPNTVDRELRHAEEESLIAVRQAGKSTEYKYLTLAYKRYYIPWSQRPDDNKSQKFKDI